MHLKFLLHKTTLSELQLLQTTKENVETIEKLLNKKILYKENFKTIKTLLNEINLELSKLPKENSMLKSNLLTRVALIKTQMQDINPNVLEDEPKKGVCAFF